jgi:hypothetical protein
MEEEIHDELKANRVRPDELTYAVVNGNNNEDLVRSLMSERKGWK